MARGIIMPFTSEERRLLMVDIGDVFHANDLVPTSGIYGAIHDEYHLQPHEVICIKNQTFPSCLKCGNKAEFQLVRSYLYVLEHAAFEPLPGPLDQGQR
jgi:hypothetical protein